MAIDDTIKSIEDALQRAEDIGDILDEAVSKFGQSMTDCIESLSEDISNKFNRVFYDAANTFAQEFNLVTDDITKAMQNAFDLGDISKQIQDLRKELDSLREDRGGGDSGDGDSGAGGRGRMERLRQSANNVGRGFIAKFKADFKTILGKEFEDVADANKVASEFRQIQGGRGSTQLIDEISNKIKDARKDMNYSKAELIAQYQGLAQAGFTEDEIRAGTDVSGQDLADRTLKADKFLRLAPGTSAQMIGEMKTFSDTITAGNATDKLLEMKLAAESTGVSFNKFSSAAMGIASSLRPLGLDISHTTNMLAELSAEYRKSGMSEERAFAMAKDNIQAMGNAFMNMDIGLLGAVSKEFGSEKIKEKFKGLDAFEAGMELRLLATGDSDIAKSPQERQELMMETMSSLVGKAREMGGDSPQRAIFALQKFTNTNESQAKSIIKLIERIEDGEKPSEKELAEVNKMMADVLKTDSQNISSIEKAANAIEGIISSIVKLVISGFISMVALADWFMRGEILGEGGRAQILKANDVFKEGLVENLKTLPKITEDMKKQLGTISKVKGGTALSVNYDSSPLDKLTESIDRNTAALQGQKYPESSSNVTKPSKAALQTEVDLDYIGA